MQTIDNQAFGQFLCELRKEKQLTQRQLADQLFLSDKAVSKWERGQSFPDISLLLPLSRILGVTSTELLSGKRMENDARFTMAEIDSLVSRNFHLSEEETALRRRAKRTRVLGFGVAMLVLGLELLICLASGHIAAALDKNFLTVELLMLIFGFYFTFLVQETLPVYYDENKISQYSHGAFRMNLPGLRFCNSNWPHIVKAAQRAVLGVFVLFPILYLPLSVAAPALWGKGGGAVIICMLLLFFAPVYLVGKKHQ